MLASEDETDTGKRLAIAEKQALSNRLERKQALRTVFKATSDSQSKRILEIWCWIIEVVTSISLSMRMRSE